MRNFGVITAIAIGIAVAVSVGVGISKEETLRVVDGDTLALGDARYRFENIDTPEVGGRAECLAERMLADLATQRLEELVAEGVTIVPVGRADQYGREIVWVEMGDIDVGDLLVEEGYARPWRGQREDWCSE